MITSPHSRVLLPIEPAGEAHLPAALSANSWAGVHRDLLWRRALLCALPGTVEPPAVVQAG